MGFIRQRSGIPRLFASWNNAMRCSDSGSADLTPSLLSCWIALTSARPEAISAVRAAQRSHFTMTGYRGDVDLRLGWRTLHPARPMPR